jgi:Fe-S-cluster containining protein
MWLKDEKCTVYEERPLMCRAFGTTDVETHHLYCPHGAKCNTPLSNIEIINLVDEYLNYMDYQGGTHRHTT